jgi:flavin reductase (DIM6/NTAB) family NADH-FMN oxidoreductase RutF
MKLQLLIILSLCASLSFAQQNISEVESFEEIQWQDLNDNALRLIGKDWMLVAAGKADDYNMMTASWGTLGWLWQKPVSTIYVRPQRHTHTYTEREDYYTLSFYDDPEKEVLRLMGTVSGKNFDKMNYEKLTPVITPNGSIAFEEAYLIIECKKLYSFVLTEEDFIDTKTMDDMYPERDFHTVYVGEITGVWRKKTD